MITTLPRFCTCNADLIILNGDPLKSIYDINVDNMDMIIKDGEEVLRYRDKK